MPPAEIAPTAPAATSKQLTGSAQDVQFLSSLETLGLNISGAGNKSFVSKLGRAICKDLDDGLSYNQVISSVAENSPDYGYADVNRMGVAAIVTYCPQHDSPK